MPEKDKKKIPTPDPVSKDTFGQVISKHMKDDGREVPAEDPQSVAGWVDLLSAKGYEAHYDGSYLFIFSDSQKISGPIKKLQDSLGVTLEWVKMLIGTEERWCICISKEDMLHVPPPSSDIFLGTVFGESAKLTESAMEELTPEQCKVMDGWMERFKKAGIKASYDIEGFALITLPYDTEPEDVPLIKELDSKLEYGIEWVDHHEKNFRRGLWAFEELKESAGRLTEEGEISVNVDSNASSEVPSGASFEKETSGVAPVSLDGWVDRLAVGGIDSHMLNGELFIFVPATIGDETDIPLSGPVVELDDYVGGIEWTLKVVGGKTVWAARIGEGEEPEKEEETPSEPEKEENPSETVEPRVEPSLAEPQEKEHGEQY
jgi:hypothetical protein